MKRFALLFSIVLAVETLHGQDPSYNRANFFSAINPAFAVSPINYNSINAGYRLHHAGSVYGHMNLNKIYSAVGSFVEYENKYDNQYGVYGAYHTYFLPRNYHLMFGAALRNQAREYNTSYTGRTVTHDLSSRLGILLCSPYKNSFFFGFSFDTGGGRGPKTFSIQTGQSLLRISRKLTLIGYAVGNYYNAESNAHDFKDILVQPLLGTYNWSAGPGFIYDERRGNKMLIRASFRYKVNFSVVLAIPTSKRQSQDLIYDFTTQYKF